MVFGQKREILTCVKKKIPSERASQEEQNGANFSFIVPSSEELWVGKLQLFAFGKGFHTYMYMEKRSIVCKLLYTITP